MFIDWSHKKCMQVAFPFYTDEVIKGAKEFIHEINMGSSCLIFRITAK